MILICAFCKNEFNILDREYRRQSKRGRKEFYCSISCGLRARAIREFGKIIHETVECNRCGTEVDIKYREGKRKTKYFCSISCANVRERPLEVRLKISKALSKDKKYKKCKYCGRLHINKFFCSKSCAMKNRIKIIRENKTDLENYRRLCAFNFNLSDYPDEFDFSLIKRYGWYKAKNRGNNLNGVSRDHMYSIYDGFYNDVKSDLIKHPANCCLITQNENSSKWKKSSITINELKEKIFEWNKKYEINKRTC